MSRKQAHQEHSNDTPQPISEFQVSFPLLWITVDAPLKGHSYGFFTKFIFDEIPLLRNSNLQGPLMRADLTFKFAFEQHYFVAISKFINCCQS